MTKVHPWVLMRKMKLPWQVRTTLLIGIVGPPVASLILLTIKYLPLLEGRTELVDVSGFIGFFILFALPVGYCFGVLPALLAGGIYCGALTAMAILRPGILARVCLGAISGGLVGGVWFHTVIGADSRGYGSIAAFVLALVSLRWPRADKITFPEREPAIEGAALSPDWLHARARGNDERSACGHAY